MQTKRSDKRQAFPYVDRVLRYAMLAGLIAFLVGIYVLIWQVPEVTWILAMQGVIWLLVGVLLGVFYVRMLVADITANAQAYAEQESAIEALEQTRAPEYLKRLLHVIKLEIKGMSLDLRSFLIYIIVLIIVVLGTLAGSPLVFWVFTGHGCAGYLYWRLKYRNRYL